MKIINYDILNITTGTIVHAVNCRGVMGIGLAKQLKQKWIKVFREYEDFCLKAKPQNWRLIGRVIPHKVTSLLTVISAFTQYDFGQGRRTEYCAVANAFIRIKKLLDEGKIERPVYIPNQICCGFGGGDWNIVYPIIEEYIPDVIVCQQ